MDHILQPLCAAWREKINLGIKHREPWKSVADDCELFFAGAAGFMWEDKYRKKMGLGDYAPTFKMTISKAFELVALFGPSLYYRNPTRTVKPKEYIYAPDEALGFLGVQDEFSYQQLMATRQQGQLASNLTSQLISTWLNYTPGEQAGGGLKYHSQLAVIDALVKGRGCLTVEPFQYPGSEQIITGAFYVSPNDVVIDPDASVIWDAKWIAVRYTEPTWVLERRYQLPADSLKDYANKVTYTGLGEGGPMFNSDGGRVIGSSFDSLTYWKVYSKGGIGCRLGGYSGSSTNEVLKMLDEQVGDYAYLVIPDGKADFPLNVPTAVMETATPDELKSRFGWPIPYWKDGKWPVSFLDFYRKTDSVWPIPPMQPGLGELKFMNVMMSHLCNRVINSCRDFVVVPQAMRDEYEKLFKNGEDLSLFPVDQDQLANGDPTKMISFIKQPEVNQEVWNLIDRVSIMFDKRVGLSELMYGYNPGAASRTAEDAAQKRSALSVRPDHMAAQVEEWQTEVAIMEHICTQMFVTPADVQGRMGPEGAQLWNALIMQRPIDEVLRETQVSIEAGTARKPNKDRDVTNITQAVQTFIPVLQSWAGMTGNPNPLNAMISQWGEANDMDTRGMMLEPPPPPPMMPPPGTDPNAKPNDK